MKKLVLLTALILTSISMTFGQMSMNGFHGGHQGGPQGNHASFNNHSPPAMSQVRFQQVLHRINQQRYESSRLEVAKQASRNHPLRSHHVRDIMHEFGYESTKLAYAKFAYNHVTDPQNFQRVNSAFNYNSSIRALENHIAQQGFNQGQGGTIQVSGGVRPVTIHNPNVGINHGAGGGHPQGGFNNAPPVVHGQPGSHYGQPAHNMILESDFCQLMNTVKRRCFDSDKLAIAKQGICNRMMTSEQVLRMMNLFTFESTRLEFAKFAYLKTCDQQNYYIVNDGFTFSSSIRELDCYIRSV